MADFENVIQLWQIGYAEDDAHAETGEEDSPAGAALNPTGGTWTTGTQPDNIVDLDPDDLPSIGYIYCTVSVALRPNNYVGIRVYDITNTTVLGTRYYQGPSGVNLPWEWTMRSGRFYCARPAAGAPVRLRMEYVKDGGTEFYWHSCHGIYTRFS